MPINTDLSVSPYFDDYVANEQNYYQVLFKPSVAVQTRELNVLQSIVQNQIEQFGDNIFDRGTIVKGCNFQYFTSYPYVKINDLTVAGGKALVNNYVGLFATSSSTNLTSYIVGANTGYLSQAPFLNTLFINYTNSGANNNQTAYLQNDVLTLTDANVSIFAVNVPVGGVAAGISNSDSVVFLSAIAVQNSASLGSGQALVGNTVYTGTYPGTVRATVVGVNATAIANTIVLNLAPFSNSSSYDISNTSVTASAWTFANGAAIKIGNSSVTVDPSATITGIIGSGANAVVSTSATGQILSASMVTQGQGYVIPPYVTVKTANGAATVTQIAGNTSLLTAQNYAAQVTIANTATSGNTGPVGFGYAFSVSGGVIYQKGYFVNVAPQSVVVSSYSQYPDQIVVGFNTTETIINSNIDNTLLDNATGQSNFAAPGADRLQLTPTLVVINAASASANTLFFPITAFSNGQPYLQNQQTVYSTIGDNIASRSFDTNGNFLVDPFTFASTVTALDSSTNSTSQSQTFNLVVDPGEAYISGYKVQTYSSFFLQSNQGTNTVTSNALFTTLNYGNYINIQQIGGMFAFNTGDYVTLYDTAKTFLSNNAAYSSGNTTPVGNAIGTARIRSLVPQSGTPGTPNYVASLYLYDIDLYPGKNFLNAQSVYYNNGINQGIADIVLVSNPTISSTNVAILSSATNSTMLFPVGANNVLSTANHSFNYQGLFSTGTSNVAVNAASGVITLQLGAGEIFPYGNGATLSNNQMLELSLVFTGSNAQANANVSSLTLITSTSNTIVAVNTGSTSSLYAGEYLKIFSNTGGEIKRVATSNTSGGAITVDTFPTNANTSANVVVFYPKNVPVALPAGSVTVSANGSKLSINLGAAINTTSSNVSIVTPVYATGQTVTPKTPNRDTTVAINVSNAVNSNTGPWALGFPDIFRMKKVYKAPASSIISGNTVVTANVANSASIPSTWIDVTSNFYVDHKQNPDFYDMGYLHLTPTSQLAINTTDALVVQFDHFTETGGGFYTRSSYPVNDAQPYANITATSSGYINTLEISEMYDSQGNYYDLIDYVDFRPSVANTASITVANTAKSTINPIDYGALTTQILTGTLTSGNVTVNAISNTSVITVGTSVFATNFGIPVDATVVSIVNSTAINISSAATSSGSANLIFSGEVVKFGAEPLSTSYQFPTPGTAHSASLVNYQGRVDRLVVDTKANIVSIPGTSGSTKLVPPAEPANTMTINLVFVPPYPSVPQKLDQNYTNIIDKHVANEIYSFARVANHTISVPTSSTTNTQISQPLVYTMSDINSLANRVAALEQQASLSALEQSVSSLAIPSSINGAINRFKYGFFADTFQSNNYTDVNNPQNTTMIVNNEVVAAVSSYNVGFNFDTADDTQSGVTGSLLTLPYNSIPLFQQLVATNATAYVPPPVTYTGTMSVSPATFTILTNVQSTLGTTYSSLGYPSSGWYLCNASGMDLGGWSSFLRSYAIWIGSGYDITTNVFETVVNFPTTGTYSFQFAADDTGSVTLDSTVLISGVPYNTIQTTSHSVSAGQHTIIMSITNTIPDAAGGALVIYNPNGTILWSSAQAVGT